MAGVTPDGLPKRTPLPGVPEASDRRSGAFLRDRLAVIWLVGAIGAAVARPWLPEATWLLVHLVVLGALTHSMFVWTEHFARAIVHAPARPDDRRRQRLRLGTLALGALAVFVGVPSGWWWLTVAGATAVVAAVAWHAAHLAGLARRALPFRFRVVVRYYLAAGACLSVGATFGAILARGLDDEWHGRLLIAHTMVNLLGWVGLTLAGTLVTFWPTLLRTRMDDRADRLARQALPLLVAGLVVLPTGALLGFQPLALAGLALYAAGVAWWGRALWRPLWRKPPAEFAPASVGAALVWAAAALVGTGILLATARTWADVTNGFVPGLVLMFVAGFAAQLLLGALSYLIPSVLGGGPSVVRAGGAWFDRFATVRLTLANAGLVAWLLPLPPMATTTAAVVVVAALASFVPLMFGGIRASLRTLAAVRAGEHPGPGLRQEPVWAASGAAAALAAFALAIALAIGSGGSGPAHPVAVAPPTGRTVHVAVTAQSMRFEPSSATVDAGDRLVVDVANADPVNAHDLTLAGKTTPRLAPGQRASLDVGVVEGPLDGWCTIPGHRQLGMTFAVRVNGGSVASAAPASASTHAMPMPPASHTPVTPVDAVLPPLTDEKVRRITLHVREVPLEVAPGVWQKRWTYNGQVPGPTLHGRVGDTFEVTLVNDGSMGHSIDFHAGERPPDEVMRTIPPGGSLVYRFTAARAGIWMYHCSTMPMSVHIAAGMAGAVIIEPDGLAPVDRSHVLVQSEVALGTAAATRDTASEVDADAVAHPTYVTFNGIARQYDEAPLTARVGRRIRIWVLDAGPTRPSSFHVVGAQFDTVYSEGGYLLEDGRGAAGGTSGGAQALALQPGQGGFVETTLTEPGHYPFVSHVMTDAEAGAHGVLVAG